MEDLTALSDSQPPVETIPSGWQELPPPLPALGILAGLSDRSLSNLATYGTYDQFAAKTVLIREGEPQNRFYVVVSGKLAVSAMASGKEIPLSTAEPGECLGEVSLLEPGSACATVVVLEPCVMWSMNMDNLRAYLGEHAGGGGALLMGMASCLSQRLRQANQLIAQHRMYPVESSPFVRERAITAENTPVQVGFFERLKQSIGGPDKKVKISTEIKL